MLRSLLAPLNEAQLQAVTAPLKPVLVLAGAGTGKTRVLVHRIAYLAERERIPPFGFLAVTFTNKAAEEMGRRVEGLLMRELHGIWLGTFHALCHRMLRRHAREASLPENFQLLDEADQLRLIRQLLPEGFPLSPRAVQRAINLAKDAGLRWRGLLEKLSLSTPEKRSQRPEPLLERPFLPELQEMAEPLAELYRRYEAFCQKNGLVDFGELLMRCCELLEAREGILEHYRRRFQAILIDEFQDTSPVQYRWARLLARDNLFVVGDDDQAIYSWRGADPENLFRFRDHFPDHLLVRLEQNYRSTSPILDLANRVIAHNRRRLGKRLWTERKGGEPVDLYRAEDERDEAEFVVSTILAWLSQGGSPDEIAILYRSHALSHPFELALQEAGIPYRVYGGLRFFERQEIKDALAYLRLLVHRHDDLALLRAVQRPPRGIGQKTVAHLQSRAEREGCSLWQAAQRSVQERRLSTRIHKAVAAFLGQIERLAVARSGLPLPDQIELVLRESGLFGHYEAQEAGLPFKGRVENLKELVSFGRHFSSLEELLAAAALLGQEEPQGRFEPSVSLMTLHAAKGLEFPLVFLVGLEEELFPGAAAARDLEEERRLFYVGLTRAREKLCLSWSERRSLYGRPSWHRPSRFLLEAGLLQELPRKYSP